MAEFDSITPDNGGVVVLKSIRYPMLNQVVKIGDYSDLERPGRVGVHDVSGRSFPVATTDVNTSVRFQMTFNTETAEQARKLHLALALGDVLFLQIPRDENPRFPPKSYYAVATTHRVERIGLKERRRTHAQFVEVVPPGALVVGTTLTWQNVFNTFGSWEQLWAANPSWSDLLATVGSGEDLVVL